MSEDRHEIVIFPNGSASLKRRDSGEPMHSQIGAWEEANLLYVGQSGLAARLGLPDPEPLILYDVGLGIAANAIAAIECRADLPRSRDLVIVSFENDLSGLELALSNLDRFPFLFRHEDKARTLLRAGVWEEDGLHWKVLEGNFLSQELELSPELIYFDFYAPKSSPGLWGEEAFKKLHSACSPRLRRDQGSFLYTYSSSTAARAAMILSGFFVGKGRSTDAKLETTIAATLFSDLAEPLKTEWLAKLRSDPELLGRLEKASQFRA